MVTPLLPAGRWSLVTKEPPESSLVTRQATQCPKAQSSGDCSPSHDRLIHYTFKALKVICVGDGTRKGGQAKLQLLIPILTKGVWTSEAQSAAIDEKASEGRVGALEPISMGSAASVLHPHCFMMALAR